MKLKSYEEFVNENLVGVYSYYGQGSLFPIVSKLCQEGKTPQQIYSYLTSLGIDEERKRKVISDIFLMEAKDFVIEGLFEDDVEDLLNADPEDLAKGVDPSKAKTDDSVQNALDKLKSGDDEGMDDKSDEEKSKTSDDNDSDKIDALKSALKDAEKLDKIKKILSETFDFDMSNETDVEFLSGVFEYHSLMEKLSQAEKDKLKDTDFVFQDTRSWPIHDEKRAKTALVWATWPQYKDKKAMVVKSVLKKYPHLKGIGAAK